MSVTVERTVIVVNESGLHFRPADLIVRAANRFQCQIELEKEGQTVDCRSIMGILMLGAGQGVQLQLRTNGIDAVEAADCLCELFASGFSESDSTVGSQDAGSPDHQG